MTVAAILLVYAAGVGMMGSRVLDRPSWALRAPMTGIVICLAAAWSVVAALGLADLTLAVHATALGGGLSSPDRSLRIAAPGHLRHAGRGHRGLARPDPCRSGDGPRRHHRGHPPVRGPASQLRDPASPVAQAIDGSARVIVAAIGHVLHDHAAGGPAS